MSEEMIDVVDEDDKVIRQETRSVMRKNALLHRSAQIIVFNEKKEIFVQKRAAHKDIWPNMFAIGVGETLSAGESYEEAAKRGLKEEIGISAEPHFLFEDKFRSDEHNVNMKVYRCTANEKLSFNDSEVIEGFFVSEEELKKMLEEKEFTPDDVQNIKKYWEMKNG